MTTATKITLVRIVLIPVFMVLLYCSADQFSLTYAALAVFIVASLSDFADGKIARKYNQVSDLGKFLDPLADKLLVLSAMCIFCQWGMFPAWALMIVLAREFAVTGLRLIAVTMAASSRRPGPARSRRPARWSVSALSWPLAGGTIGALP